MMKKAYAKNIKILLILIIEAIYSSSVTTLDRFMGFRKESDDDSLYKNNNVEENERIREALKNNENVPASFFDAYVYIEYLDLSNLNISELPSGVEKLVNLKVLNLRLNKLQILLPEQFGCYESLRVVDISDNCDIMIPDDFWEKLRNVEVLKLNYLKLKDVPLGIRFVTNLKKLYLDDNEIEFFSSDVFANIPGLELLSLRYNGCLISATNWGVFISLRCLILNECLIDEIPEGIFELATLEELHLGYNNMLWFDPYCFKKLTNLRVLDVNGNNFVYFSTEGWEFLSNLEVLILNDNFIFEIPDIIAKHFKKLRYLNIRNTKMKKLTPSVFQNLENLEELDASNNRDLVVEDETWKHFKNLKFLGLSSTEMISVKDNFRFLKKLVRLDLHDNKIKTFKPSTFGECKDLKELDLSENPGIILSSKGWVFLRKLTHLNLSKCSLKEVPVFLTALKDLTVFRFCENGTIELGTKFFDEVVVNLPSLKELDLRINNIKSVPRSILPLKDRGLSMMIRLNDIKFEDTESTVDIWELKAHFGNQLSLIY